MVTSELFEVAGAVLALFASTGWVGGKLIARDNQRALERLAATIPDAAPSEMTEASTSEGPYRSPGATDENRPSKRRRGGRLFHHDYDLMIGRTLFR